MALTALDALRFARGWVMFRAVSASPERLLDGCARYGIPLWDVRFDGTSLTAKCLARDYRRLRRRAVRGGIRPRAVLRRGLPFAAQKLWRRSGLPVGAMLAALGLWWLGGRVWAVDVQGNEKVAAADIIAAAAEQGVTVGSRIDGFDVRELRLTLAGRIDGLSWASVNFDGCVAHIAVTERGEPPAIRTEGSCSDLVASCDGVIVRTVVQAGERRVKVGEAVTKGDLLVAGRITTDRGDLTYRSVGQIFATVEETLTVRIPLRETLSLPTGRVCLRPTLCFLGWKIPLYTDAAPDAETKTTEERHFLRSGGRELPCGIAVERQTYLAPTVLTRTAGQAEALANAQLQILEAARFADAEVLSCNTAFTVEEGVGMLTAHYTAVRDIAEEVVWPEEQFSTENFVQTVQ